MEVSTEAPTTTEYSSLTLVAATVSSGPMGCSIPTVEPFLRHEYVSAPAPTASTFRVTNFGSTSAPSAFFSGTMPSIGVRSRVMRTGSNTVKTAVSLVRVLAPLLTSTSYSPAMAMDATNLKLAPFAPRMDCPFRLHWYFRFLTVAGSTLTSNCPALPTRAVFETIGWMVIASSTTETVT